MHKVKIYPGEDCAFDPVSVVLDYCMKLKNMQQPLKERKLGLETLIKIYKIRTTFKIETENQFEALEDIVKNDNKSTNEDWNKFKIVVVDAIKKLVGKKRSMEEKTMVHR